MFYCHICRTIRIFYIFDWICLCEKVKRCGNDIIVYTFYFSFIFIIFKMRQSRVCLLENLKFLFIYFLVHVQFIICIGTSEPRTNQIHVMAMWFIVQNSHRIHGLVTTSSRLMTSPYTHQQHRVRFAFGFFSICRFWYAMPLVWPPVRVAVFKQSRSWMIMMIMMR